MPAEEERVSTPETAQDTSSKATGPKAAFGCLLAIGFLMCFYLFIRAVITGGPGTHPSGTTAVWIGEAAYPVVKYMIAALFAVGLVYPLAKGTAQPYLSYYKRIRPVIVLQNLAVVAAVICVSLALLKTMPWLNRSWLYHIPAVDGQPTNLNILPFSVRFLAPVYAVLILLNLPDLAHSEEMSFRHGTKNWKRGIVRSIKFGLSHCVVGVPVYVGLALSIGGLWFTHQYFKGGVERSTLHHLTYNLIIIMVIVACMVRNGFVL